MVSTIITNYKLPDTFLVDVKIKIARVCGENSLVYMINTNILKRCLFTDVSHAIEQRKCILGNNSIDI